MLLLFESILHESVASTELEGASGDVDAAFVWVEVCFCAFLMCGEISYSVTIDLINVLDGW